MGILVSSAAQVATDEADPKVLSKGVSRLEMTDKLKAGRRLLFGAAGA